MLQKLHIIQLLVFFYLNEALAICLCSYFHLAISLLSDRRVAMWRRLIHQDSIDILVPVLPSLLLHEKRLRFGDKAEHFFWNRVCVCVCVSAHRPLQSVCQWSGWICCKGRCRGSSAGPGWRNPMLPREVLQWGQPTPQSLCFHTQALLQQSNSLFQLTFNLVIIIIQNEILHITHTLCVWLISWTLFSSVAEVLVTCLQKSHCSETV